MILYTDSLLRNDPDYPIVDSSDIKGGLHTVGTLDDLNSIKGHKLTDGMLAYVLSEDTYYKYNKTALNWELAKLGGSGVPIYTNTLYDDLTKAPEDCIIIRDLEGESLVIENLNNISYLGTVFQAIRELQAQVAKIQNSFKYGINSFTETRTAMSTVLGELDESTEDEPLWSLEEDSLSLLEQCTVETNYMYKSNFTKLSGDDLTYDDTNSILSFPNSTYAFVDPINGFKQVPDPKSIIYISSSNLNISITLKNESGKVININLKDLNVSGSTFYNTMLVVSKKIKNVTTGELYGQDYLWILIIDPRYNLVLQQGYYNNGTLTLMLDLELDNLYYIELITFSKMNLYKMNSYTKALDFSYSVIPTIPLEEDYKLGVAHLTIRSISTESILDKVKDLLLDNELIWVENLKKLCIKSKGNIYNIGSISEDNNNNNTTMTIEELIASLRNLGIISINKGDASSPEYTLKLSDVSGITFIHEDSGKRFDINIDSEGNLRSSLINNEDIIKDILTRQGLIYPNAEDNNIVNWDEFLKTESGKYTKNRGFLSNVFLKDGKAAIASDSGLYSDRLKIGAIYTPYNTTTYGCSHAYIELENTSAVDINLQNFYLSVAYTNNLGTAEVLCLPLKGVIKSGSTFLIRGKLYASYDDINTNIKVKSFDLEWYVDNKLIDLEFNTIAFLLTYDKQITKKDIGVLFANNKTTTTSDMYSYDKSFVDGCIIYATVDGSTVNIPDLEWFNFAKNPSRGVRDCIYKNTFELDPAKLAFQGLHVKDSSRIRGLNANDFKAFYIDLPTISFPNSNPIYDISLITPKASYEHKNVSTDKTKLNINKPNMVYCSFGIDMYTTRCFNWISVGSFNEYIWVRKKGETTWEKFESYNGTSGELTGKSFKRKDPGYVSFLNGGSWSQTLNSDGTLIPLEPYVYKRMHGRFPGDGSFYTAHKCILSYIGDNILEKLTFEYVVGRSLITGQPDENHISDILYFTLYPSNTIPKVYHITDLQGFYWLEYLTWSGAANVIANKIKKDLESGDFMPVLINTGDVTQNGTRINEWLDYYLGGENLFKYYEHMSVVGNNDLCNTDPAILGTGDDYGKSNGYYHHLFNCYEILDNLLVNTGLEEAPYRYMPSTYYFDANNIRFVNVNSEFTYINCYDWFNIKTKSNLIDCTYNIYTGWKVGNSSEVPTEYYLSDDSYKDKFIPLYNHLYKWFTTDKKCIVSCHEIPFTVMTLENLAYSTSILHKDKDDTTKNKLDLRRSRSYDLETGNLVGSHLNHMTKFDNSYVNWFSRLLETKNIHLCIGGHKHTYTCTYPVREFYYYENGTQNSFQHGPRAMNPTLEEPDTVTWDFNPSIFGIEGGLNISTTFGEFSEAGHCFLNKDLAEKNLPNTSRTPIVYLDNNSTKMFKLGTSGSANAYTEEDLNNNFYLPGIKADNSDRCSRTVYFMCLATGYKLTSNKELPGYALIFTLVLPQTTIDTKNKSTASSLLKYPMFAEIFFNISDNSVEYSIALCRITSILNGASPLYIDVYHPQTEDSIQYLLKDTNSIKDGELNPKFRFGSWVNDLSLIINNESL